ncbi:tRNA (adenosine(37)-N6)-threonylcarbamoyltransferase complex dimerization subunit type 1 TsaB [Oceanihabitans sediminis]|uniref:tRNA (Adenosine(37)-N6)-threonylcarbamoyltransferase complex dimerization subunit type 1 TsaB n=1 Tax=Oceanihabitans sediminis TaxID=1812012 RepID=A0A368P8A5_9FLAO|nr:tRNA (adenosine(37)-N6)-threonylcarbamoyltransferase complex dimerization subunit type 1 TsaB [Oceanihabitans sediminis]MDX1278682.1 tRNA (adenosine(37)-N6)-threonylcarbamoyltransferase complex dimerization subunit type 1 TsaB [Oceanihabitans sediminis]MDX1772680.1 tRNA (adenosine(37)-N6)-threonylcarbamoyltransferase complex dimerization subunit type 1 TsaB [Oceanihabitans sediminis]RBP34351.1 tRNA threonylcarbamoyladenosine biosynthesis protein TsaB [Oceanihabitans sediminis]RCU58029.1 tRNA
MSIILNIETATTNCSVSLSKEGETFALLEDNSKQYSHAERLHVYINQILEENNIKSSQIDAIAVSKGPGSYTGLRIGVSAAKGLCFALDKPLISVSTLEALARQVKEENGLIIPMLDARRMEVYSAVFDANFNTIREIEAQILDEQSFASYLEKGKVYFIGNGVEKTKGLIQHENAVFIDDKLPSANEMSVVAYNKYKKSDIEDVAYFEPYYLKDFVALKPKKKS